MTLPMNWEKDSSDLLNPQPLTWEQYKSILAISQPTLKQSIIDDPISDFLRNYFRPKVIVAACYEHAYYHAGELGLRRNDVVCISTDHANAAYKLMGLHFRRKDVIIYETADWGKYYEDVMRELRFRYVDRY